MISREIRRFSAIAAQYMRRTLALRSVEFGVVCVIIFGVHLILRDTECVNDFTVSNKSDFPWCGKAFSVVRGFGILGKYVRKSLLTGRNCIFESVGFAWNVEAFFVIHNFNSPFVYL